MAEQLLIRCSGCGKTNRVPPEKLARGRRPVCGACRHPLPIHNGPVTVTDATFSDEVEHSPLPVLLDVWAPWCSPCRMLSPVIDQLALEMAGRLKVAKLNADESPLTAARFRIQSIPALLVLKQGREVDRMLGVQPKTEIERRLLRAIA